MGGKVKSKERALRRRRIELALDYMEGMTAHDIAENWDIPVEIVDEELQDIRYAMAKKSSQQKMDLYQSKIKELAAVKSKAQNLFETLQDGDASIGPDGERTVKVNSTALVACLRLEKTIIQDETKMALELGAVESLDEEVRRQVRTKSEQSIFIIAPEVRMNIMNVYKKTQGFELPKPTAEPPWELDEQVGVIDAE